MDSSKLLHAVNKRSLVYWMGCGSHAIALNVFTANFKVTIIRRKWCIEMILWRCERPATMVVNEAILYIRWCGFAKMQPPLPLSRHSIAAIHPTPCPSTSLVIWAGRPSHTYHASMSKHIFPRPPGPHPFLYIIILFFHSCKFYSFSDRNTHHACPAPATASYYISYHITSIWKKNAAVCFAI